MRTRQNSGSSTICKSVISRGAPLPRRHKRLIENARLRSKLSSNDSSQLQISNRERIVVSRHAVSPRSSFDPQGLSLVSLIANLELEFQLTGCGTNHMQFSNRKFSAIFHCGFPSLGSSRLLTRHSITPSLSSPLASSMLPCSQCPPRAWPRFPAPPTAASTPCSPSLPKI